MEPETKVGRERDALAPEPYEPPGVAWEEAFEAVAASCASNPFEPGCEYPP
jgi:hypothetical protein